MENSTKENILESKHKVLLQKLEQLKEELQEIIHISNILQNEIESNKAEIEVLENFHNFVDGLSSSVSNLKKLELLKNQRKLNQDSKEAIFYTASQLQKEVLKREKDLENLKNENSSKLEKKENLKEKISEIKKEIHKVKNEANQINKRLILHYHTLLSEGKDTRSEGLVWIIKAIWNLGNNVIMSYMPDYLDTKGIDFIFSIAHKDYELEKINGKIQENKNNLKEKFFNLKTQQNKKINYEAFKTEIKVFYFI